MPVAVAVAGGGGLGGAVLESVWQVLSAVFVGVAAGWLGGRALRASERHRATEGAAALFFTQLLAIGVLGVAGLLHADGVLAVFVAALAFNAASTGAERGGGVLLIRRTLSLSWRDALYLGWFGPVGVSALFYLTLQADKLGVDRTLLAAGSLMIAASVVAHGLTGKPGRRLYARSAARH